MNAWPLKRAHIGHCCMGRLSLPCPVHADSWPSTIQHCFTPGYLLYINIVILLLYVYIYTHADAACCGNKRCILFQQVFYRDMCLAFCLSEGWGGERGRGGACCVQGGTGCCCFCPLYVWMNNAAAQERKKEAMRISLLFGHTCLSVKPWNWISVEIWTKCHHPFFFEKPLACMCYVFLWLFSY